MKQGITIRFPKSMCSEPFMGADGALYSRIIIPGRGGGMGPSFDLPTKNIHAERNGTNFLSIKVDKDGVTRIHDLPVVRESESGKYSTRDSFVPNPMLRAMVETNIEVIKARDQRASILNFLRDEAVVTHSIHRKDRVKTSQMER